MQYGLKSIEHYGQSYLGIHVFDFVLFVMCVGYCSVGQIKIKIFSRKWAKLPLY